MYGLPGKEYWLNEISNRQWRIRAAARDIGAFESTSTNSPVGPYSPEPQPQLNATPGAGIVTFSWPLFAQDFQLQQSAVLTPPNWTNATYATVTNVTGILATIPASANAVFRLMK